MGRPDVAALVRALVEAGSPIVAVALRGPWDADAYPGIGTVLATYGIQAPSLRALSAAVVGEAAIDGRLPVRVASAG
jgi:hypothetical protein